MKIDRVRFGALVACVVGCASVEARAYVPRTTSLYRVPGDAQTAAARADVLTDAYPAAVARIALNARRIAERS